MLHVLLVEDNPSDVLMVREATRTSPIPAEVMIAHDGQQALKLLGGQSFDLVILDLNIPIVNGFKVLERYQIHGGPTFVVFSGSDDPRDKKKALALGAKGYVVKPFGLDEFMNAVRAILQRWPHDSAPVT
jgi:two-component system response regulator VanR